jgi:glycerol-3-phosphate dehydrogenase
MDFSYKNRDGFFKQLANSSFDVLIIGGGITGAGIALDAATRGLKVALVEMQDFASGTSGRSTKLIHGGLRYLKQGELKLVAEVGKEREIIYRNAPHITRPEPMLLPIIKKGSLNKFTAALGMWFYEKLAGVKKTEWHKNLNKEVTTGAEPLLQKDNLRGGILFYEYRTDDARLTIEVIKEAVSRGVVALNYTKCDGFIYTDEKITGAVVKDLLTNEEVKVKAKYIINAGGPWVDELDDLEKNKMPRKLKITKGVHIVVDKNKLPVKQAVYFDTFDKRMIFVIPRGNKTYIGTTDTFYSGDKTDPKITNEDRNYLLKCVNDFFSITPLKPNDIESGWAGLRPLISKPGKGPSEISRKDEIFISESGLLMIAGGKLTGYRKMAERIIDKIADDINKKGKKLIGKSCTANIKLSGGNIKGYSDFEEFEKNKVRKGLELGLTNEETQKLIYRYGSEIEKLFFLIEQLKNEVHELPLSLRGEIAYVIKHEMCVTPSDFFIRRTGSFYFDIATVINYKANVMRYMKDRLGWNDQLHKQFKDELEILLHQIEKLRTI